MIIFDCNSEFFLKSVNRNYLSFTVRNSIQEVFLTVGLIGDVHWTNTQDGRSSGQP